MSGVSIGTIRFNPRTRKFEGPVSIHSAGRTLHIPCAVSAARAMNPAQVHTALIAQAQRRAEGAPPRS